jgi:CRISPR-associated protein Cmr4
MTTAILGLLAQTSIHAGAGTQTGIIDLPIQREGHNGYPCVYGSAVKGALRDKAEQQIMAGLSERPTDAKSYAEKVQTDNMLVSVYGSMRTASIENESTGAIIVTDARLLLFPVRSLTSQFKWVTCPYILRRYQADCARLSKEVTFSIPPCDGENQAFIHNTNNTSSLFLEEYRFEAEPQDLTNLISVLVQLMQRDNVQIDLEKQVVIVSDDNFTHLVNHATPVNAHIALDALTKTTKGGALWYEETLPPETLLYIGLSANKPRRQDSTLTADGVLNEVLKLFPSKKPYLQLGGNETVGMGWCIVKPLEGK